MSSRQPNTQDPVVHLPSELPVLNPEASRILLQMLIELTTNPAPERAPGEEHHD